MAEEPRLDDDGSARTGTPITRAASTPSRGRPLIAALVAVALAAITSYGAWPIGLVVVVPSAIVVALMTFGGVYALSRGQTLGGVLVIFVSFGMTMYCVLTGFLMEATAPYLAQQQLDPLVVADRTYLMHPTQGFLIRDPGEGWVPNDTLAGVLRLSWSLVGETQGAWGWSDDEHGAWIVVLSIHVPEGDTSAVDAVGAMMHGILAGTARESADPSAPPLEEDVFDRDDTRHESWARVVGERAGGPIAAQGRTLIWDAEDGGHDALVVMVTSHPDDEWRPFLLDAHVPHDRWQGPGGAPREFTPAARTLVEARAAYTSTLTREARFPRYALEDAPGYATIHYGADALDAYATPVTSTPPCAGLVWLGSGDIADDLDEDWIPAAAIARGAAVMIPTLRGEADNAGGMELFDGELDDLSAARDDLIRRTGLPAERLVIAGLGMGGTLTLLHAELGEPAGAYIAIGAMDDQTDHAMTGPLGDGPVFEVRRVEETWIRSPIHFVAGIRAPTFAVWGEITSTRLPVEAISLHPNAVLGLVSLARSTDEGLAPAAVDMVLDAVCAGRAPTLPPEELVARVPPEEPFDE